MDKNRTRVKSPSMRSRRLEVAGERENGRARGRHALACLLLARALFLVPTTSTRLLRRLLIPICSHLKELRWVNQLYLKLPLNMSTLAYRKQLHCSLVRPLLECIFSDLWDDKMTYFLELSSMHLSAAIPGGWPRGTPGNTHNNVYKFPLPKTKIV